LSSSNRTLVFHEKKTRKESRETNKEVFAKLRDGVNRRKYHEYGLENGS